jgi:hypothetical protein
MENLSDRMRAYLYKLDMSVKKRGILFSVGKIPISGRLSPKSAWGSGVLMFFQISD